MRDRDVRSSLRATLLAEHTDDLDSTLFVDELGLCGEARVDVAVVNAALSGFELKSASDTLKRLPTQVSVYSRVLDYATLVVAENHLDAALAILPAWWGCIVAREDNGVATLDRLRDAEMNPNIDPFSLAQLLWLDEVTRALENLDAMSGMRSKPRMALWARLGEVADLDTIRDVVRSSLKARSGWRDRTTSAQFGRELVSSDAMSRS